MLGDGFGVTEVDLSEALAAAIRAHREEADRDPGHPHACGPRCSADVRAQAGDAPWSVRALEVAWGTHGRNLPHSVVDGELRWQHGRTCTGDCAVDIAARFTSRCGEWRDSRVISLDEHVDLILAELHRHGVRICRDRLVVACMPALVRAGQARPPEHLLLDAAGAAQHYDALVAARCPVIEVRGSGWIPGRRYLVLLDHAWSAGSTRSVAVSWPEWRGTVGVLPAWLFEALERRRPTRRAVHSLGRRIGFRETYDIPVRARWGGEAASEQGCPTVPPGVG